MIEIICNDETYTYNAYHIVKAFYPSQEVKSCVDEKASNYVVAILPCGENVCVSEEVTVDKTGTRLPGNTAEDKKIIKHRIDTELYRKLETATGQSLSWGILTGVRPTKIAMKKLEDGMAKEEFIPWFMEDVLASEEKSALAWEIAEREKALLDQLDYENGYSLYVGIPFCPTVCTYCSFSSGALSAWKNHVDAYLDALCKELAFIGNVSKNKKLNTIYIGGGTPTTLSAEQLDRLLNCIDANFSREHLLEFTVEAGRPDSITKEKLQVLRSHDISRISINPQSMQQKTLDAIGRKHTVQDIVDAYNMARELGFDNINMDIIAGLPGEDAEDMKDTLAQIEKLAPDSLTVHSLAIKRAAKMGQERKAGQDQTDLDAMNANMSVMIHDAAQSAKKMELYPYYLYRQKNIAGNFENVGYAKVDKAGIYNILIMEEKQSIVAAGAGASTKIVLNEPVEIPGNTKKKTTTLMRLENVKAIDAYINRIDEMIERKGEWLWR
ncbi:MAG: coproporphyrinogen dehydrogenase HemZ [Dorea sp.]